MSRSDTSAMPSRTGSIDAAAERLGCTSRTVRRYIAAGDIRAFRVGKRMVRVDMDSVDAMLRPIPTVGGAA